MVERMEHDRLASGRDTVAEVLAAGPGFDWLRFVPDEDAAALMELATRAAQRGSAIADGADIETFRAIIERTVAGLREITAGIDAPGLQGLADDLELRAKMLGWRRGDA